MDVESNCDECSRGVVEGVVEEVVVVGVEAERFVVDELMDCFCVVDGPLDA